MTLIFTSNQQLSAPLSDTPVLPDTSSGLAFDFSFDSLKSTVPTGAAVASISSAGSALLTLSTKLPDYSYPSLIHAGPNGHAALRFEGNHMISTPEEGAVLATGQDATIALVVRTSSEVGGQRIVGVANALEGYRYIAPHAGGYRAAGGANGQPVGEISGSASGGNWHVLIATYAGAGSRLQVDAAAPITGNLTRGPMLGLRFGRTGSNASAPASNFTGDIARVMIYRRALSVSDATGLAYELMTTYGIK